MNIKPEQYVEIPADKVRDAIAAAYDLSHPVGMGVLHARSGPLDAETIDKLIEDGAKRSGPSMDYVHGRQCKFHIRRWDDRYFVSPDWYDHSHSQLVNLLTTIGIGDAEGKIAAALRARTEQVQG